MSSRRKFLLVFCFILLDMFLLVGFLVIRDATFLNDLKKEVENLKIEDVIAAEENEKNEDKKKKEVKFTKPRLNFVLTTYYKGTALEIGLKKLEEYLDGAEASESDINNI